MANVAILPDAEAEYQSTYDWYQARSPGAAAGFEAAVEKALAAIAADPEQWPLLDKTHRCFVVKRYPYLIVYRVQQDEILVVAVAHGRKRPGYWRRRR